MCPLREEVPAGFRTQWGRRVERRTQRNSCRYRRTQSMNVTALRSCSCRGLESSTQRLGLTLVRSPQATRKRTCTYTRIHIYRNKHPQDNRQAVSQSAFASQLVRRIVARPVGRASVAVTTFRCLPRVLLTILRVSRVPITVTTVWILAAHTTSRMVEFHSRL